VNARAPLWLVLLALPGMIIGARPARARETARPDYPRTRTAEVADTLHGTTLVDPYRWLEDGESGDVLAWTKTQGDFTRQWLARDPNREELRQALLTAYRIDVLVGANPRGQRLFVTKKQAEANHSVVSVLDGAAARAEGAAGAPRVVLDPNGFSSDGTVALDWWYPSHDGALVAYGKSAGGSEMSTLYVRDARTGEDLPDVIPNTQRASLAWDPDGKSFLYTRHPAKGEVPAGEEHFHITIRRHRLGDDPAKDAMVWDGKGAAVQEYRGVSASSDGAWHFVTTSLDWSKNDLYVRRAGTDDAFVPVAKGLDGRTNADAWQGRLYLLTNVGAPRYRVVSTTPDGADAAAWTTVVPELEGVIESMALVDGRLAIHVLENAHSRVLIYGLDGRRQREIELPSLGTVSKLEGDPAGGPLYFTFTGFVAPGMVYRCDVATGAIAPLERRSLPFDPASYETEQVWATSKDGTKIPLFLVRKKGTKNDGERPTRLYGYGGFNVSQTPSYRAAVLPWLDRGGVFATAALRGGGEFGRAWHEAGRLAKKQNTFDDYYAAAEWLIANGVTKSARLVCEGGSNGGLLVGAAITQRPELWGAALCEVPLLDMIRYQKFSIARFWVPEYGSSENPEQFASILEWSPYQNVREGVRYPPTLLLAGEHDSRVDPLHARKMAAVMQAKDAGPGPILLRVEDEAGHGQGKPMSKVVETALDKTVFLDLALGLEGGSPRP
jgi:prolyl oligopeptidase